MRLLKASINWDVWGLLYASIHVEIINQPPLAIKAKTKDISLITYQAPRIE